MKPEKETAQKFSLKNYWELLSQYIRAQRWRFGLLVILLLSSIGLQVVNPQILRGFIDSALAREPLSQLLQAALTFLGIAIIQQLISVLVTYLGENVAWTATNQLRADLARHCLNLDMGFHNEHTPGELIERIDGDITELAGFFSQFVIILAGNLLLMAGILIALFLEDWRVGLGFTIYALISVLVLNRVRDIAVVHQKARRQADAELFGFIEEQLAGTEDIRSSGAVNFSLRELIRFQANIFKHNRKAEFKGWQVGLVMGLVLTVGYLLAVGIGFYFYQAAVITLGTVYLFIQYMNNMETPIWAMTHQVQSFQTIGACVERLIELRKIKSIIQNGNGTQLPSGPLALKFKNVSFAYETEEMVLKDISFQLKPGKVLGLLGRTGSGKTTLARLIFRLYDPQQGTIALDGADLNQPTLETLRQHIAIVTQEVQVFRASIRDNITFFDRTIGDDQIHQAIEALDLGAWYRSLPAGLDTDLEAGSHSLSAGEAQLLAFTRVFLRNPGLVILDEASSRLDPATEAHIERAIDRLLVDRTAIIIAHRLGTVERADEILILDSGQVSEYGERTHLAFDPNSKFYQLLKTGLEEVLV